MRGCGWCPGAGPSGSSGGRAPGCRLPGGARGGGRRLNRRRARAAGPSFPVLGREGQMTAARCGRSNGRVGGGGDRGWRGGGSCRRKGARTSSDDLGGAGRDGRRTARRSAGPDFPPRSAGVMPAVAVRHAGRAAGSAARDEARRETGRGSGPGSRPLRLARDRTALTGAIPTATAGGGAGAEAGDRPVAQRLQRDERHEGDDRHRDQDSARKRTDKIGMRPALHVASPLGLPAKRPTPRRNRHTNYWESFKPGREAQAVLIDGRINRGSAQPLYDLVA
jgi:hypothetical protein